MTDKNDRNRDIFQRRASGETYAAIGKAYSISTARVRDIISREETRLAREAELKEAARLPQQPNYLHLPPRLRKSLAKACGKEEFRPEDVVALDYTPAMFMLRLPGFRGRDWRELCAWIKAAGLSLEPPRRTFGL